MFEDSPKFNEVRSLLHGRKWSAGIAKCESIAEEMKKESLERANQYLYGVAQSNGDLIKVVHLGYVEHSQISFWDITNDIRISQTLEHETIKYRGNEFARSGGMLSTKLDEVEDKERIQHITINHCVLEYKTYESGGNPFIHKVFSLAYQVKTMEAQDWHELIGDVFQGLWSDKEHEKRKDRWDAIMNLLDPDTHMSQMYRECIHWIRYSRDIPNDFKGRHPNFTGSFARRSVLGDKINEAIYQLALKHPIL